MVNRDEPEEPDDKSAPDPGGDWWPDEDAADQGEAEFDWQLEDLAPPLQPPRPRLAAVPDDPGGADDRVRWGNSPEELLAELLPQVDELAGHVADMLTPHKRPRVVRFLDELPRNEMGKVQKKRLTA